MLNADLEKHIPDAVKQAKNTGNVAMEIDILGLMTALHGMLILADVIDIEDEISGEQSIDIALKYIKDNKTW